MQQSIWRSSTTPALHPAGVNLESEQENPGSSRPKMSDPDSPEPHPVPCADPPLTLSKPPATPKKPKVTLSKTPDASLKPPVDAKEMQTNAIEGGS